MGLMSTILAITFIIRLHCGQCISIFNHIYRRYGEEGRVLFRKLESKSLKLRKKIYIYLYINILMYINILIYTYTYIYIRISLSLLSFDVTSLFTSVPLSTVLDFLRRKHEEDVQLKIKGEIAHVQIKHRIYRFYNFDFYIAFYVILSSNIDCAGRHSL